MECIILIMNLSTCNLPVFVWTPKGDTYLETQPSYTIGHIKSMIQEKKGFPSDELKLIFAGQLLEDGRTLSDYNIQDGATLTLGRMDIHIPMLLCHTSFVSPNISQ